MMKTANLIALRCPVTHRHLLGLGLLCLALVVSYAQAQTTPAADQPAPTPPAEPAAKTEPAPPPVAPAADQKAAKPKPAPQTGAKDAVKRQAKTKGASKGKKAKKRTSRTKMKMDPNAKWACDKTVATHEPVWRGDKKLTFNFDIRNEGTADLKIRARGG